MILRVGLGYRFSPTVAAEIGSSSFISSYIIRGIGIGTSTERITPFSEQIAVVWSRPLSPQFDLFGKIGVAHNSQKFTVTTSALTGSVSDSTSDSANDLLIGFGAQFHVNSKFSLRAQYENFGNFGKLGNSSTAKTMAVSASSIGLVFDF